MKLTTLLLCLLVGIAQGQTKCDTIDNPQMVYTTYPPQYGPITSTITCYDGKKVVSKRDTTFSTFWDQLSWRRGIKAGVAQSARNAALMTDSILHLYPQPQPLDTVKAVVLYYQTGPAPMQKQVWAARRGYATDHAHYPKPDEYGNLVAVLVLPQLGYDKDHMEITGYLDTDRRTPITFKYIWQTALIEW